MTQETHNETAVYPAAPSVISKRKTSHGFLYGVRSLYSAVLAFLCTVVWPKMREKVIVPVSIFIMALLAAMDKFLTERKHSIMCNCHQIVAKISRARAQRLTGVALLMGTVVFLFSTVFYSFGIEVIIDGESLGYVVSQEDYNSMLTTVQTRVSRIMGQPHSVSPNVSFSFGIVARDKILEGETLERVLYSKIEGIEQLYAVLVDGKIVGACNTREGAEQALALLTASDDSNIKREILTDVRISFDAVDASDLCTSEELATRLRRYQTKQTTHIIKKGETARSISNAYGMTRAELRDLNPEMDTTKLTVGEELVVLKVSPIVSVREFRHVTETVSIPYETKEIKDSSLYVGKKSVKTNGVAGKKQIVADVTYVDGEIADRKVISETVLSEPTTKVVLVGTKPLPKKAATGTFRRPVGSATISSNYGYRRSGFHTGVDFALRKGSPVYASDGGTVSFSGWKGGYGYLVIINHGNGMQTYYAHNSKLLVSRGDKVGKGEQIAKVGSTGNSSGPHVHFEVRVNGKHVNPWRYID